MASDKSVNLMNKLLNIKKYDEINECFVMNDGTFLDIIKIRSHDLLNSDEDKVLYECYTILKWLKTYPFESEIIGMNFPVDTTEQQIYFEHVMERTENPQYLHYLEQKLIELRETDKSESYSKF